MLSLQELQFAQRFPYSNTAKRILKSLNCSLDSVGRETVERAATIVEQAAKRKPFIFSGMRSTDLLQQEVLAFPVAKILVSLINDKILNERFANAFASATFSYLESEHEKRQVALQLADELGVSPEIHDGNGFMLSIPIDEFLKINFSQQMLRLVNQSVEKGRVYLNENSFCRYLSEIVFSQLLQSLPVSTKQIPEYYKAVAKQLKSAIHTAERKQFEFKLPGKINPNAFPTCMQALYGDLLKGKNLPHLARFDLATFLAAVGMSEPQIVSLFSNSPNFSERITKYQVKRLIEQKYVPPSCAKIREHAYCPDERCNAKHPLRHYRRALRSKA